MKVLFVCQANVGRSQMAEAYYNFHTQSSDVRSVGVEDFREKYHHRPTAKIIDTMLEKGINISNQRIDFLTTAKKLFFEKSKITINPFEIKGRVYQNFRVGAEAVAQPFAKGWVLIPPFSLVSATGRSSRKRWDSNPRSREALVFKTSAINHYATLPIILLTVLYIVNYFWCN